MPYGICPVCGTPYHVSVGDVGQGYKDCHPDVPVGEPMPGRCYYCWQELTTGDPVVVRRQLTERADVKAGDRGRIRAVFPSTEGNVYSVELASGRQVYFVRAELRKARDNEQQPREDSRPDG